MSLRLWLPLNGDLHNQGLDDVTVINNGATVSNSGKIGKCYEFDGNDDYISLNSSELYDIIKGGSQPFTIAFWIYHADATRAILFGDYGLSGTIQFNIELNASHSIRFYWAASPDFTATNTLAALNTWTHIAIAYDGSKIDFYTNGALTFTRSGVLAEKNKTSGMYYLGRDSRTGSTALNGRLNDVRIYDEALSPKEVKELAKGLVLHYTLNRGGFGQDNLLKASNEYVTNSSYCIKSYYFGDDPPQEGEEVTIQIKGHLADTKSYWNVYNSGGSVNVIALFKSSYNEATGIYTATGNWVITKGTTTATNKFINVYAFTSSQSGESTIEWIKLERGSTATPWIPNSADDLYSAMGLDNGIEYDVSGYGNNGFVTGSLAYSSDTPRYLGSTYFNGGDNAITVPFNSAISDATIPFTINLWFKKTEIGTDGFESLFGGPSGFEMDTRAGSATSLSLYMASTRGGAVYSPFNLNEWYMVTMASDRTNEYYYVNGELAKTITAKSMPVGSYFIGAWSVYNRQNYKGLISDFRIYSTCLSSTDILVLYNTPVSIANNGTLMTQGEISEV